MVLRSMCIIIDIDIEVVFPVNEAIYSMRKWYTCTEFVLENKLDIKDTVLFRLTSRRVWLYNDFDIPYIKGQNQRKNKPVYILFNHLRDEIKQFHF